MDFTTNIKASVFGLAEYLNIPEIDVEDSTTVTVNYRIEIREYKDRLGEAEVMIDSVTAYIEWEFSADEVTEKDIAGVKLPVSKGSFNDIYYGTAFEITEKDFDINNLCTFYPDGSFEIADVEIYFGKKEIDLS